MSQPLVLCLRNAFDITIRQTIKRIYRLQPLELRFVLQMEWCISITHHNRAQPGRVAQSVTCLATDAFLTGDPGVASSISVRSHTFVEIDHEIISTVILLPSASLFKKGCCQLQAKICARITG